MHGVRAKMGHLDTVVTKIKFIPSEWSLIQLIHQLHLLIHRQLFVGKVYRVEQAILLYLMLVEDSLLVVIMIMESLAHEIKRVTAA